MEIKDVFKKSIATKSLLDNYHDLALPSRICYDLYSAVEAHQIKYDNANFYVLSEDSDINRIVKLARSSFLNKSHTGRHTAKQGANLVVHIERP